MHLNVKITLAFKVILTHTWSKGGTSTWCRMRSWPAPTGFSYPASPPPPLWLALGELSDLRPSLTHANPNMLVQFPCVKSHSMISKDIFLMLCNNTLALLCLWESLILVLYIKTSRAWAEEHFFQMMSLHLWLWALGTLCFHVRTLTESTLALIANKYTVHRCIDKHIGLFVPFVGHYWCDPFTAGHLPQSPPQVPWGFLQQLSAQWCLQLSCV